MKLDDIKVKKGQSLFVTKSYAHIGDEQGHLLRGFKKVNGDWVEVNIKQLIAKIAKHVKPQVDINKFLVDLLSVEFCVESLEDLAERVDKEAKVKPVKGCYGFKVYGKKGKPFYLWLTKPWATEDED